MLVRKLLCVSICVMIAAVVFEGVGANEQKSQPFDIPLPGTKAYTKRGPIRIMSASEFTPANGVTSGTGSDADPYIISGWEIDASATWGILICSNASAIFRIKECHIYNGVNSSHDGIYLDTSIDSSIQDCWIHHCKAGIYLWQCNNIQVFRNNIRFNDQEGVRIQMGERNSVQYNWIQNNTDGTLISYSKSNKIINNQFENNSASGVSIWYTSSINRIYANNFYFNGVTKQASDNIGGNIWNATSSGNFWNDWTTPDVSPKDGIVDVPYILGGTPGGQDALPLAVPQTFSYVSEPLPIVFVAFAVLFLTCVVISASRKKE